MMEAGGLPAGVDFSGGGVEASPFPGSPHPVEHSASGTDVSALGGILRAPPSPARTSSPWGQGEPSAHGGRVQGCVGEGWVLFLPFLGESGSLSEFTTCRAIMLKSNCL